MVTTAGGNLRTFASENPFLTWCATVPVAALLTFLPQLVGGGSVTAAAREQRGLVIAAAVLFLLGGVLAVTAQLRPSHERRSWQIGSAVVTFVSFALYVVAMGLAHPDPTVEGIGFRTDHRTGAIQVTVSAHDLRSHQRLRVRARWADRRHSSTSPHDADGKARTTFTATPLGEPASLRVIAYVAGVKDAGSPPTGFTCGDYEFCADDATRLQTIVPDLRASVHGRTVEIAVPRMPSAPGQLIVVVFQAGRELFKDNPLIGARPYRTTVRLRRPHAAGERACVVATFDTGRLRGCATGPGVVHKAFDVPR